MPHAETKQLRKLRKRGVDRGSVPLSPAAV